MASACGLAAIILISPTLVKAAGTDDNQTTTGGGGNRVYTLADHERFLKDALAKAERSGSESEYVTSLNRLAGFYWSSKQYEQAEPLYKRCIQLEEKSHGANAPQVAFMVWELASMYKSQGRTAEASPLFERALLMVDGPDFENTLAIVDKQTIGSRFVTHIPELTPEQRAQQGNPYEERVWTSGYRATTSAERVAFALAFDRFRRMSWGFTVDGVVDGRLTTQGLISVSSNFASDWWKTNSSSFASADDAEKTAWLREAILDADHLINSARAHQIAAAKRT